MSRSSTRYLQYVQFMFTICQIIITSNNQPDYSGVSHAVVMPHATPSAKRKKPHSDLIRQVAQARRVLR